MKHHSSDTHVSKQIEQDAIFTGYFFFGFHSTVYLSNKSIRSERGKKIKEKLTKECSNQFYSGSFAFADATNIYSSPS